MYRINLTNNPNIVAKLQAILGKDIDLSKFAVYEARVNDTAAITNTDGFYRNARMTENYLTQMQNSLKTGQFVPLIELHDQHGRLPVGRLFDAALYEDKDSKTKDLHALFYVTLDEDSGLAAKLDSGIVNEVSTGTSPSALLCSECGFDFLASAENRTRLYSGYKLVEDKETGAQFRRNTYSPMCDKGHLWGESGVHLQLGGLKKWSETSLVTRGAVDRARILTKDQAKLASEQEFSLAAWADDDKLTLITLSGKNTFGTELDLQHNTGGDDVSTVQLELANYDALILAKGTADALSEKVSLQEAKIAELQTKLEAAEASTGDKTELETKLAAAEAKFTELETKHNLLLSKVKPDGNSENPNPNEPSGVAKLPAGYFKQAK